MCVHVPTLHALCSKLFVTRMAAPTWEEESRKCGGGQGGSSSQQGPGKGWICDALGAPNELQKDSFHIWNKTPWSQGSLMFSTV